MEEEEFDPATGQDMSDTWAAFWGDPGTLSNVVEGDYDKNDLIRQFSKNMGIQANKSAEFVDEVLRIMTSATIKHGRIILSGFGSMYLQNHAPESGIDPHGKPYEVGARISAEFKAGGGFKSAIVKQKGVKAI